MNSSSNNANAVGSTEFVYNRARQSDRIEPVILPAAVVILRFFHP